jgi:hypothetical protein
MSEEPNQPNNELRVEKLLIDDLSNFQFHTAYMVYEDAFDKTSNQRDRAELNQNIQDLKDGQLDVESFYQNIAHYRKIAPMQRERFTVQTQRKRDWRMKSQRQDRIRRHKN